MRIYIKENKAVAVYGSKDWIPTYCEVSADTILDDSHGEKGFVFIAKDRFGKGEVGTIFVSLKDALIYYGVGDGGICVGPIKALYPTDRDFEKKFNSELGIRI